MFAAPEHHRPIISCRFFVACLLLSSIANAATSIALSRKTPKQQGFLVGMKFSAWVARVFLCVDDESAISPPIMAMVTAVR